MAAITVELSDVRIERGANQNAYMCGLVVNKCEPGQKTHSFTLPSGFKGIREKSFKVHDGKSNSYIFVHIYKEFDQSCSSISASLWGKFSAASDK